jgi:hypothetical protein
MVACCRAFRWSRCHGCRVAVVTGCAVAVVAWAVVGLFGVEWLRLASWARKSALQGVQMEWETTGAKMLPRMWTRQFEHSMRMASESMRDAIGGAMRILEARG